MKAIISELWDTGIDIITTSADSNDIASLSDLHECDNVLIDEKVAGSPFRTILMDDSLYNVSFRTVSHPTGCGKLRICEIY